MSLPILQIKRRNVNPQNDVASGGQPNGLIAGELGYNYYNGTLWIGPEGSTNGKSYSILLNRDRRITAANWKNGTTLGPTLTFTEWDQNGYLREFSSSAIPVAGDGYSGVVKAGGIQDFSGTKLFLSDGSLSLDALLGGNSPVGDVDITIATDGGIISTDGEWITGLFGGMIGSMNTSDGRISGITPQGLQISGIYNWNDLSENYYNSNVNAIAHFVSDPNFNGGVMAWATPADLVATGISTGAGLTQEANIIKHINSIASGTIEGSSSTGLSFGNTIDIPSITYDNTGHISSVTTTSVKLPTISAASATTTTAAPLATAVVLSATGELKTTTFTGDLGGEDTFVYFSGGVPTAASTTYGSKTKPVYVSGGKITAGTTYAGGTKVTLNGSSKSGSTASFYAPTAAGTAENQFLVWDATNKVPIWKASSNLSGLLSNIAFGGTDNDGRTLTVTFTDGTTKTAVIPATISGFTEITSNKFTGDLSGNADTATKAGQFTSSAKVKLTGDVTGEKSSTHGWEFATTLASSGVTAGAYGPTETINPGFGGSYKVPYIKVDAKGRVTEAATYNLQLPVLDLKSSSSDTTTAATFVSGLSLSSTGTLSITKYNGTLGSTKKPIYLNAGVPTEGAQYAGGSLVNLNGTDKPGATATFFAPTAGGTANQILKSNGSSAPSWINQSAITAGKATADASGNTITSTYETKSDASSKLTTAKTWATTEAERVKDELLNGAGEAYDTLIELGAAIDANGDAITALETVAASKAAKTIQIKAGAGLTGGGTLEADRTISHSNSVTARNSGTQTEGAPGLGGTFTVTEPKYDAQGHITGIHQATITMPDIGTVSDDNIVNITATKDDTGNEINISASHAAVFNKTYTSGNTVTTISGAGGKGTIKIPQITVNSQGHITAAADEEVDITMPSMTGEVPAGTLQLVSAVSASGATLSGSKKTLTAGTNIKLTDSNSKITIDLTGIVAVANGGTGNDAQTANRLIYSESASKLSSSGHYATSSKLFVNSTTADSNYTFKVNGATGFSGGHIYLTGATGTSTGNTTQLVFGTPGGDGNANNHIVLSSNKGALIINPTISSTSGQIVFYLNKPSSIPGGIDAGASTFTSITGPLNGNATSATRLETARTFTFKGDVVETSFTFDGTGNPEATLTLANSGVTAGSYGPSASVSPGHTGTFSVPYVTVDAKGRVTSISTKTITLPSDNNTDTKVTQNAKSDNVNYPLLGAYAASPTSGTASTVVYDTGMHMNPSTNTITATTFAGSLSGNASTATVSNRSQYLETWYNEKDKTYGASYPLYAWWETGSECRLKVDNYIVRVDQADKLTTARTIRTNLASTSTASFDGSANITPGVTGVLGTANGGTGLSALGTPTVTWTAGTSAGPTLTIKDSLGKSSTAVAIPSAGSSASGIITTGSQTFAGSKTFTGTTTQQNNALILKNTSLTKGTAPSSDDGMYIVWCDNNGTASKNRTGMLYNFVSTGNVSYTRMYAYKPELDATSSAYLYVQYGADGTTKAGSSAAFYGAVWNDYAEYRICNDDFKPGQVVLENGNDTLSIANQRLQRGCSIVSDTFGFAIGETDEAKCPIAVSGRVLAYGYESREEFKKHIGWSVCSGPNGTVSIMTEEEEEKYPSRIIGTISAVPEYETWGTGNVAVNNRIWIKIK